MSPLAETLKLNFGNDFPVGSGTAKRDDPLVITDKRDYVDVEYAIANLLMGDDEYELESQQIRLIDGRAIDELVFAAKPPGSKEWTMTRRFFFDVTVGFNRR